MKKNVLIVYIAIIACSLSACGFHLRKNQVQLNMKYPIIILPDSGSHTLHQALQRALFTSAVQVLTEPLEGSIPQLLVISQGLTYQPLVYGPDGELRRERIKMAVVFTFGTAALKQFELAVERDRQLNNKQTLGDNAEKILIEQEMQTDIIDQLLRFLANGTF